MGRVVVQETKPTSSPYSRVWMKDKAIRLQHLEGNPGEIYRNSTNDNATNFSY